jgi:hypothetical protein
MKTAFLKYAVVALVILFAGYTFPQDSVQIIINKHKHSIENLIAGINSDNEGLRKSSIYFAGKYKLPETVDALVEQLFSESNPSNRILIARALYEIGERDGIEAVKHISQTDSNKKVRRISSLICKEYFKLNENNTASK